MWSLVVHGGSGNILDRLESMHRSGCQKAVELGASILKEGGTALDAVCAAVRELEDDPVFNSGVGAALNEDGQPFLDAAVMNGDDLGYGAVTCVLGVRHPVELARAVLEDGRHCLLSGPGAVDFARKRGLSLGHPQHQVTSGAMREWQQLKQEVEQHGLFDPTRDWTPLDEDAPTAGNTVGAVARDDRGGVAAATSTGGTLMRYRGRVGDTPIAGSGTYADSNWGAISATGHGETMLRTAFGVRALIAMQGASDPESALDAVLNEAKVRVGGKGGAIVVLPDGRIVARKNTKAMGVAWQRAGTPVTTEF